MKEVYDYTTNRGMASYHDLAYGIGGAIIGSAISLGYVSLVARHERKQEARKL